MYSTQTDRQTAI